MATTVIDFFQLTPGLRIDRAMALYNQVFFIISKTLIISKRQWNEWSI